jgi:hypothetical protein
MIPQDAGRMTNEDVGRLGRVHFTRISEALLTPEDRGLFLAIDVLTGDFEKDRDDAAAVRRMRLRNPSSEVYLTRAGYGYAYGIGFFE